MTPADQGNAPANANQGNRGNNNDAPANQGNAPANEANAPVNEANAPANEANAPVNEANAPANEANAPANEANAPANEANAPANTQRVQPADLPRGQSLRERIIQTPRGTEERNTLSIAEFPYIVRNIERFGILGDRPSRAVTQFRNLVTREGVRDNELLLKILEHQCLDAATGFETRNPNEEILLKVEDP